MELEAFDQAVDYYTSSTLVLNDYRHIKSFSTIQNSADSIMDKLKKHMLVSIQEPDIRMTQLEDFVRLLMKLHHPMEDLYTIYLNYHRTRLNAIIEKYQKLKPLSEDEKEIISLSGSEEEVEKLREKQKVTNSYPLLQFMDLLEKVCCGWLIDFSMNDSSMIDFSMNDGIGVYWVINSRVCGLQGYLRQRGKRMIFMNHE